MPSMIIAFFDAADAKRVYCPKMNTIFSEEDINYEYDPGNWSQFAAKPETHVTHWPSPA